jgi:ABC-type nitrate/sulfonate/bicarbonate transport system substrate-binding protein
MDVHIGEIVSTVRAVDGDALVNPQTLEKIVRAVLRAVDERDAHQRRVRAEQRVTSGVREEQGEEE